jgi:hypothetical protein
MASIHVMQVLAAALQSSSCCNNVLVNYAISGLCSAAGNTSVKQRNGACTSAKSAIAQLHD